MKNLIKKILKEELQRDWIDSEYSDEYPKYKDLIISVIKNEVASYGQDDKKILLGDSNNKVIIDFRRQTKELWYDYDFGDYVATYIPWHTYNRHFKYALHDYFKGLFPDVEIKSVKGANITYQ